MNTSSLHVDSRGPILVLTIERAHKRNALDEATVDAIAQTIGDDGGQHGCAVLASTGDHFSAGLDLTELTVRDAAQTAAHSRWWHRRLEAIQFGPLPVVAALRGAVIGGGLELAAAAHLRVADTSAFYALPEGERGIFVGGGGSVRLPRLVGVAVMADMMLTGRVLDAHDGHRLGISQYLVDDGLALEQALALASRIATNAPITNYAVTHVLPRIADASHEVGLVTESLMAAVAQSTPEAQNRLDSFLDGTAPKVVAPGRVRSGAGDE